MEELVVLEGKDTNEADAKVNTAHVQKYYTWTQFTLRHFNCIRKKRENIAGGKFGPRFEANQIVLLFLKFL